MTSSTTADQGSHDQDSKTKDEPKKFRVEVHDEDDGAVYHFDAQSTDLLEIVIVELYTKKLRRERQPDDRLTGEPAGDDVFASEHSTFAAYATSHHIESKDLTWLSARGTGGA